jgi:CelD/BcsL family acetyltransferase involved in cellulose biosynthesis
MPDPSSVGTPLVAETIDDPAKLDALRDEWDALAVAAARPYCSPAWMLAWWRHARPSGARLQVVTVHDDERLVGIAPLWQGSKPFAGPFHRLLAGGLSAPVGPLAVPGREAEVAAAIASALAGGSGGAAARVLRLDGQQGTPVWPTRLADAWPAARPWIHSALPIASPTVQIEQLDYERWLAGKTQNFRQQARRFRRRLEKDGARFVAADLGRIDEFLQAFVALHGARWSERGGSNALVDGLVPMLSDAARELLPLGRFRAFGLEVDGAFVSVQLFVAAGGEVSYWNGGFDERWERSKPALQTLLFAVGDAMERGDSRIDLGPGAQDYKLRLADGEDVVDTVTLVPRGPAYPSSRLRLAPYQARWGLSRRLTPEAKRRLRRLARR